MYWHCFCWPACCGWSCGGQQGLIPPAVWLAAAYYQPANILWLKDGGVCRPGQAISLTTAFVTLDCSNSSFSGEGDTLTINWHVRPKRCFVGGCGVNKAYEYVRDNDGLWDAGVVGWWVLYSLSPSKQ